MLYITFRITLILKLIFKFHNCIIGIPFQAQNGTNHNQNDISQNQINSVKFKLALIERNLIKVTVMVA